MASRIKKKLIKICIYHLPASTPAGDDIYIAGNFNDWREKDKKYKMYKDEDGVLHTEIEYAGSVYLEFKFCRGSWSTVEADAYGNDVPNHFLAAGSESVCFVTPIEGWKDQGPNITYSKQVSIYELEYNSKQLNTSRRVLIYLPPDYRRNVHQNYPVLYIQDGQNIFSSGHSSSNTWNVNDSLNHLYNQGMQGFIVVGIEHGGTERINEYSPWIHPEHGGGKGKKYLNFLVETIKPSIDQKLRTRPDRDNTAIIGSSMGGLLSMYAVLTRHDTFGKAGVFSPSFWFTSEIFALASRLQISQATKIFLMGGNQESENMRSDLLSMYHTLVTAGFEKNNLHLDFYEEGTHQEWFWAREFSHAIEWLFEGKHQHHQNNISFSGKIT